MKKILTILIVLLGLSFYEVAGQVSVPGMPESFSIRTKQSAILPKKQLDRIDTASLLSEDARLGIVNRYAVVQYVGINIKESGVKTEVPAKGYIWRYQLSSVDAYSLGLLFSSFILPEGARLFVYSHDHANVLGAFSSLNNKESGILSIAELASKQAIIEYFEPYTPEFEGKLVLGSVTQSYKDLSTFLSSSVARVGINCPEGSEWQDEKHSVCRMTYQDGRAGYYCTGFLVNNVLLDGTPYFMTANHCISSNTVAATLVTYFNYENSSCSSADASELQTISGATLKSTSTISDFSLLVLDEIPPIQYQAYLAGWDASTTSPKKGTAIHHPSGTPKCISVENDNPQNYPYRINWDNNVTTPENSHWSVKFDIGNTESGSSGSPLFDGNSRVIGQLHGGDAVASYYGKFSVSWNRSTAATAQLKAWLDPTNTGITFLDGSYLKAKPKSAFSVSYPQTCLGEVITLIDRTTNLPTSWLWKIEPSNFAFVNGTSNTSRNPQVVFTKGGTYNATLIASNFYGTDTFVNNNVISVNNSIKVNLTAIPQDTVYCGYNLNTKPLVAKGAHNYVFSIGTEKLGYTVKQDTLVLSVNDSFLKHGSFNAKVKVTGYTGICEASDSVNLKIIIPPNDYIENAIRLWPGNNDRFNNICGCAEKNEPMPPLISCISDESWCPGAENKNVNSSIWFTFLGPSNGKVTIDARGGDSRMAVYEAETYMDIVSGNQMFYTLVAANDNRAPGELAPKIENLKVVPGKKYWLQVDSKTGTAGDISVALLSNSLEVFPNPTDGNFDVIISTLEAGMAEMRIYSNLGKELFAKDLDVSPDNNRFTFDFTSWSSGIYIMKVKIGTSTLTSKVMILY